MLREELRVTKERLLAMSWEANARERKNVGEKEEGSGREEGRKGLGGVRLLYQALLDKVVDGNVRPRAAHACAAVDNNGHVWCGHGAMHGVAETQQLAGGQRDAVVGPRQTRKLPQLDRELMNGGAEGAGERVWDLMKRRIVVSMCDDKEEI